MDSNTVWADALKELTVLPGAKAQEEYGDENFLRAARFRLEGRALFEGVILPAMAPGRRYAVVMGFVDREVGRSAEILGADMYAGFESAIIREEGSEEFIVLGFASNFTADGSPPAGEDPGGAG